MTATSRAHGSRHVLVTLLLSIGVLASGTAARAEGFISPFAGYDFGGDTKCPQLTNCADTRLNTGVSLGVMGHVLGLEEEFAYAPDFFGVTPGLSSSVVTLMTNLMVVPKIGRVRPYVLAGVGAVKTHVALNTASLLTTDNTAIGWDMGGGVIVSLGRHVGVRGDLRYFRGFKDIAIAGLTLTNSTLTFGRGSLGLVLSF